MKDAKLEDTTTNKSSQGIKWENNGYAVHGINKRFSFKRAQALIVSQSERRGGVAGEAQRTYAYKEKALHARVTTYGFMLRSTLSLSVLSGTGILSRWMIFFPNNGAAVPNRIARLTTRQPRDCTIVRISALFVPCSCGPMPRAKARINELREQQQKQNNIAQHPTYRYTSITQNTSLGNINYIYIYEGCSKSKVTFQFSPATYIQVLNFSCRCVGTLVTIICSQFWLYSTCCFFGRGVRG